MNHIIVAVDGPAGSGKSTVSREVALRLGISYIDSGAMYRAITWYVLDKYGKMPEKICTDEIFNDFSIKQEFASDGRCLTYVNGKDVSLLIRSEEIAGVISTVSDNIHVREYVNQTLRSWSHSRSIIMDGRDIGSVVFPNANLKLYLDASVEVRAKRRVNEYSKMGKKVDENEIKKQIMHRDRQDTERKFGALKRSNDMQYIDTSRMTLEEVIQSVAGLISQIQ